MDQLYFEEGYIAQGYHVYIAEASVQFTPYIVEGYLDSGYFEDRGSVAALTCIAQIVVGQEVLANGSWSSNFNLTVGISKLVSVSVDLNSSFSQSTIATRNSDIDLFAFSDAAISIQVQRIRDNNITASSAFTIAIDGARVRYIDSAEQSAFSFDVVNQRSRATSLNAQAAFSLAASVNATVDEVSANLVSTFSVYANGGFRLESSSALNVYSSIFTTRLLGTDRPKTLTGTFNSTSLINSSSRVTDLSNLPTATNWYYQTEIQLSASNSLRNFQNKELLYIPLGTRSGAERSIRVSASYPQSSATAIVVTGLFAPPSNLSGQALLDPGQSAGTGPITIAVSFTESGFGPRAAVYINGTRVAVLSGIGVSSWTASAAETIRFSQDWPFTISPSSIHTAFTNYAWFTYGNLTNSGAETYSLPTPSNTPDTIFLYNFNGNGNETTGIAQTGAAAITSTATLSARLSGVFNNQSNLQSSSSLACTISHIEGADLTAFSNAALTTEILRIKQLAASVQTEFTVSCQGSKVTDVDSDQSCSSAVTADASVIRDAQIATEAVGTQLTAVVRLAGLFADDLVIASLSADAVVTRSAESLLVSNATVAADNFRVRFNSIDAASEFTNVVQGFVGVVGASDMSAVFAQNTDANRFRDNTATLNAVSELLATGNNLGKIEGSLFDAVSMTIEAVKITSAITTANTTATVAANTDISLTKDYQSAMSASFADSFTAEKRVGTFAFLTAFASKLTVAVKQTVTDLDVEVISSMSVSATKTTSVNANFANTTTQSTVAVKTARPISSQASEFAQTTTAIKAVFGSASLSVLAFELVAAVKTAGISISTNTAATMTMSAVKTARTTSSLNSTAVLTASILRIRSGQSALNSNFAQISTVGYLASAQITIASAMTFVSEVREIHIEEIVYVIPGEIWEYEITSETRLQVIGSESREYIIT